MFIIKSIWYNDLESRFIDIIMKDGDSLSPMNAVLNGWSFQTTAGVFLFIKNIDTVVKFKFEGEEDLVFFLNDGSKIYAEAKCSLTPTDMSSRHVSYHLDGALEKIGQKKGKDYKFMYVTNILKPFNDEVNYNSIEVKKFCELSSTQQQYVETFLDDAQRKRFELLRLKYDDSNKLLIVEEELKRLVYRIPSANIREKSNEIINEWFVKVFLNGSKKDVYINKQELVWKMILIELKDNFSLLLNESGALPHSKERIKSYYLEFIEPLENNIKIIHKVYSAYWQDVDEGTFDKRKYKDDYSRYCVEDIRIALPSIGNEDTNSLANLLVSNIIRKGDVIYAIKEVTNFENK